jgi:hypothetical protein
MSCAVDVLSVLGSAIVRRMKSFFLVAVVGLAGACVAPATSVRKSTDTQVSSAPACKEIPNTTGKPARCEAVRPSSLQP